MGGRQNEVIVRPADARAFRSDGSPFRIRLANHIPTDGTNCQISDTWMGFAIHASYGSWISSSLERCQLG